METKTITFTFSYDPILLADNDSGLKPVLGISEERADEMMNLVLTERDRQKAAGKKQFNSLAYAIDLLEAKTFSGNELLFLFFCGISAKMKMQMLEEKMKRDLLRAALSGSLSSLLGN